MVIYHQAAPVYQTLETYTSITSSTLPLLTTSSQVLVLVLYALCRGHQLVPLSYVQV